jgi:hypothetical protein
MSTAALHTTAGVITEYLRNVLHQLAVGQQHAAS